MASSRQYDAKEVGLIQRIETIPLKGVLLVLLSSMLRNNLTELIAELVCGALACGQVVWGGARGGGRFRRQDHISINIANNKAR